VPKTTDSPQHSKVVKCRLKFCQGQVRRQPIGTVSEIREPASQQTYIQIMYYINCMSEILTVRVDKELKSKIKKHRINASKIARAALEEEIKKHEEEELSHRHSRNENPTEQRSDKEIIKP